MTANGWLQIEDSKAQGYAVVPGFSGSPVWDEQADGVVGLVVRWMWPEAGLTPHPLRWWAGVAGRGRAGRSDTRTRN